MKRYLTKKILALAVSVSLMAGSVLPVFAAEAGTDAVASAAGVEAVQEAGEHLANETDAENAVVDSAGTDSSEVLVGEALNTDDDLADVSSKAAEAEDPEEAEKAEPASDSEVVPAVEAVSESNADPEIQAAAQQDDAAEITDDAMDSVASEAAMAEEEDPNSGTIGSLNWAISGTTLTISGSGAIPDYTVEEPAPWNEKINTITELVIENGVTGIGANAFAGAAALKKAKIPASVASIVETAFTGVSGLEVTGSFKTEAETFAHKKRFTFIPDSVTDLSGASVTLNPASYTYDGKAKTPSVSVTYSVTPLKSGKDYTVSYSNNVNAGTATVTVSGAGNFKGSAKKTFTIAACSIAKASVSGVASKIAYVPGGVKPVPKVALGSTTLKAGTDYQVAYAGNTKVGTATITITGKGNYNGQVQKKFSIVKTSIKKAKIAKIPAHIYTGKKIRPNPVITVNGVRLKKGTDYTLKYKNNKKVGKATVTIKGKGNFKGKVKKTFKIRRATIADAKIKGLKNKEYTGSAITQKLKVKLAKKTLKSGRDYKISYQNNVAVGKATVTIKGIGNYKGSRKLEFKITRRSIVGATVTGVPEQGYTGKKIKPDFTVKVGGRTLKKGTDYSIKYSNNVNIGTASFIIKGKGNYQGSIQGTFKIVRQTVAKANISVNDCTYNGADQMPVVTVTLNGKKLKAGTDFKVRYTSNVNIGTARVTVTGMGIYAGEKSASFKILPPKPKFKSVANSGKNLVVKWYADEKGSYSYQIQCGTDRSFRKTVFDKTVLGTTDYIIDNRQTENTSVRIRAVYNNKGDNYYSEWTVW